MKTLKLGLSILVVALAADYLHGRSPQGPGARSRRARTARATGRFPWARTCP